jgi:hypothetical protein
LRSKIWTSNKHVFLVTISKLKGSCVPLAGDTSRIGTKGQIGF